MCVCDGIVKFSTLTVENYDSGHADNDHKHQRVNHSDSAAAD